MKLLDTELRQVKVAPPEVLVRAIERLAGARSRKDVIEVLRSTARTIAGADGICIVLRDNGKCHYIEEEAISPLWKGGKFPLESCISGWAMINDKTVVIPDVFLDHRIPHALYRERFVKSLVMVPIGRGEPIAALGAYWARVYEAPKEVVETLETLARAAATALENAHLIEALSSSLRKTELAREDLRHRMKNALAAIDAYGSVALSKEQARGLSHRVAALSRAHDVLDQRTDLEAPVLLSDVITAELAPYRAEAAGNIELSGPEVKIAGAQAIALGLAINELALNSARTGAMVSTRGALKARWREAGGIVQIDWQESGGSSVIQAAAESIGSLLLKKLINGQLKGNIRGAVNEAMVTCFIEFPNDAARDFPANASAA